MSSLKFVLGKAGSGKTEYITKEAIKAHTLGKNAIIIVPEQYSHEREMQMIEKAGFVVKNMHDHVAVIEDRPSAFAHAFSAANDHAELLFHLFFYVFGKGDDLRSTSSAGNNKAIGKRGFFGYVDG